MKKFYLLLVAVMVTLSSFAAQKFASSATNLQLKDGAIEQMQQAKLDFEQKFKEGKVEPMRTWTDSNGVVWNAVILNQGGLWEYFVKDSQGTRFTKEELPAYVVMMRVYTEDQTHVYNIDLGYPAAILWFYDSEKQAYDEAECAAVVGEENVYKPAPLEWLVENEEVLSFLPADEGIPYCGIMDPYWFESTCIYNGEEGYTVGSDMTLQFTAYDSEISWLDFSLTGSLTTTTSNKYISINYSGDAAIFGLTASSNSFTPDQVHVFNTGVMDYDTSDWALVYLTEFEPVTRYYLMFCAKGFGYSDENGAPLELTYADGTVAGTSFSETELPSQIPYQIAQETDPFTCGFGALFAAVDSEKPYGRWTLPVGYEYDTDYSVLNPAIAYELLLGGYSHEIANQDGMCVVDENYYYHNPQVGGTELVIGDINEGLRFTYVDNYGDIWDIQYKGDIFYHGNADNYTEVELLPAVGTEEYYQGTVDSSVENIAMPETEKINVKVVGNSIVAPEGAEIYNLNGVRVNANDLSSGLYIVKVGKNAVKVVL